MPADRGTTIATILGCVLAPAFGLVSFWCSRGQDGRLFDAMIGFGLLACGYAAIVAYAGTFPYGLFALHLVCFEAFIIGAMLIQPELDEMAGMLYLILPFLAVMVVLFGAMIQFVFRRLAKSSR